MASQGGGGGGSNARAIDAGGASFRIFGIDQLTPMLDKIKGKVKAFASFMKQVGTGLALGGAAAGAGLLFGGISRGNEISNLSRQFNVPIELMARLKQAADAAGVSVEEVMNDTTGKYSDLVNNAQGMDAESIRASAEATRAWRDMIVSLENAVLSAASAFLPLITYGSDMIQGIVGGLRAGDIENSFAVVAATVKVIWLEFLQGLDQMTAKFVQRMTKSTATLVDTFKSIPAAAQVLGNDLMAGFFNNTLIGRNIRNYAGLNAQDIDNENARRNKPIMQEHSRMLAAARDAEKADLDAARAELQRALALTGVKTGGRNLETFNAMRLGAADIGVKGGFGGSNLMQRFGYGDVAGLQTELLKQIAANTKPNAVGNAVADAMAPK